jgi:hypothetical protein
VLLAVELSNIREPISLKQQVMNTKGKENLKKEKKDKKNNLKHRKLAAEERQKNIPEGNTF